MLAYSDSVARRYKKTCIKECKLLRSHSAAKRRALCASAKLALPAKPKSMELLWHSEIRKNSGKPEEFQRQRENQRSSAFDSVRRRSGVPEAFSRRSRRVLAAFAPHAVTIGVRGRSKAIWSEKRHSKSQIRMNYGMP